MQYKIENNKLIPPPVNYRSPTGWIMNFNRSPEKMTAYGWRNWTEEEIAAWKAEHPDPEPPPRTTCTKYELVTCLRSYFPELLASLLTPKARICNSGGIPCWTSTATMPTFSRRSPRLG